MPFILYVVNAKEKGISANPYLHNKCIVIFPKPQVSYPPFFSWKNNAELLFSKS